MIKEYLELKIYIENYLDVMFYNKYFIQYYFLVKEIDTDEYFALEISVKPIGDFKTEISKLIRKCKKEFPGLIKNEDVLVSDHTLSILYLNDIDILRKNKINRLKNKLSV